MAETVNKAAQAVHLLAAISRLGLKAFSSKNQQALIFLILNDTLQVIRFNRASLWDMSEGKPVLLGFSGEASTNAQSTLAKSLTALIEGLQTPKQSQIFAHETLTQYLQAGGHENVSVVWLPIVSGDQLKLGLLLERWDGPKWQYDEIEILSFLMQNYAAAWDKFEQRQFVLPKLKKKKPILYALFALFVLMFLIRVPLRIVAPCEVVPENPVLITAPLDGIINTVTVTPGENVHIGDVLFEYDKDVLLQDLEIAEKQVKIIHAEITKAVSLSREKKEALTDLGVLQLRLKKEQSQLDLARYRASKLTVTSPIDGMVIIDDPDEWRGNPVQVGEKVMMISNPDESKVRIWIPENDNIDLDPEQPIKVILNVTPDITYEVALNYIAAYTTMSDKNIPSFIAEAHWVSTHKDVKLGLKGTAILYGENVSLIYWLLRHPWTLVRTTLGF